MFMYLSMLSDNHLFDASNIVKTLRKMVRFTLSENDNQTLTWEEVFAEKKIKKLLNFFSKLTTTTAELRYLYATPYGHDSNLIRTSNS